MMPWRILPTIDIERVKCPKKIRMGGECDFLSSHKDLNLTEGRARGKRNRSSEHDFANLWIKGSQRRSINSSAGTQEKPGLQGTTYILTDDGAVEPFPSEWDKRSSNFHNFQMRWQ